MVVGPEVSRPSGWVHAALVLVVGSVQAVRSAFFTATACPGTAFSTGRERKPFRCSPEEAGIDRLAGATPLLRQIKTVQAGSATLTRS